MSKEIYISSTPHETRLAIVENDALTEIYYERENEYTLAGSIYNGKVTRVLPGMQSSFVDIGLERDAFLYITDFMEEAGDSADFDSHADNGRAPRTEGRRDARDSRGAPPTLEGNIASPPDRLDQTTDSGLRSSERTERPERAERGDRKDRSEGGGRGDRGRRGRRDRGGNRDRQPGTEGIPSVGAGSLAPLEARRPDQTDSERPVSFTPVPGSMPVDGAELGEGAPGADGSRRWRGRRGRRRSRGAGERDQLPQSLGSNAPGPNDLSGDPHVGKTEIRDDNSHDSYDSMSLDASAIPPAAPRNSAPIASAYPAPDATQETEDRSDRGNRGDRNERSGRNDRNDRGGRNDRGSVHGERGGRDRDQRGSRVPRGFAPKASLYGVDNQPAYDGPAGADTQEPIVLPGESLSKYRKGDDGPAAASKPVDANVIIPAAPGFSIPSGWDGGATLPGESLSRHRRSEPRAEHRQDSAAAFRTSPQPVQQTYTPVPQTANQPHSSASVTPESRGEQPNSLANQPEPTPSEEPQRKAPAPLESAEYEPTAASASYRLDPVAPSEYRQSGSTLEAGTPEIQTSALQRDQQREIESEPEAQQPAAISDVEHHSDYNPEHSPVHTITPDPGASLAPIAGSIGGSEAAPAQDEHLPIHPTAGAAYDRFDWQAEPSPVHTADVAHELTSVHATGEMSTEEPIAAFAPERASEPADPIQHETAVVNRAENTAEVDSAPPHFAPGDGELEEETLDEEDYNTTLHASSIEEMEDFEEEETLEGAADLGTMIREMSIDEITRSSHDDEEDEEEDDLEEEDAFYDPLHADLETGDEEDLDESDTEEDVLHEGLSHDGGAAASSGMDHAQVSPVAPSSDRNRDQSRDQDRGRGRRDGRRGDRNGRDRFERPRNTGGAGDRERSSGGGRDRRGSRSSMQSTNLPAISELLKPGQEILVQIAKEPIAKKGARITSHIALPGRFLVFMPTVNHTGVSRKIDSDQERRRLKEILLSEKGEAAGGFIVRTAADGASEEELRSDLRFLLNLWADIKQRSESSKSPALIYHDLNLVERILRDQVTDNFSAIWVDTETEYERVLRFLQRFQPSLIRRVKLYTKDTPLFEQFGITEEINKALRSKVWLKSGGSIVINQTEALVAIDINTGKFVGKTARLEDTIVKTNLDAIPEIVRQIRLRDLGGIIIIDFIDMDERKNRNKVMAALEEELKSDRAPSKVLQFNDFGLVAITRKRVKQSLERTLSTTCNICVGTGMVKSPVTVCNDIYVEMRKMHKHLDRGDVMLRVHPEVVKQLKTTGGRWLQEMEEMVGKTILVKSDPSLHPEQFDIH